MMIRTYGRRHREGVPLSYGGPIIDLDDSDEQDGESGGEDSGFGGGDPLSQDSLFSSQGSTRTRFDLVLGDGGSGGGREGRKKRRVSWGREGAMVTLMETQESGEMMESIDEVNFALDGLRGGQPVRVRRASLGSLLRFCGTPQRRRLLRANGMVRTIADALFVLSLDDLPSNLAAVTLLYLLTSDGQDDQLLESPRSIGFLIKMLKPVALAPTENKASKFGLKLSALRKDPEILCSSSDKLDISSSKLMSKVKEVLANCKDLKGGSSGASPELSPKWIALMTMEKASLTSLALDESSGAVRKMGGKFKEKLCEFGGLDAVFEVSMHCYTVLEGWKEQKSSSFRDDKHDEYLSSTVLLLKCLRIMENATFMSKENQIHLLEMRGSGRLDSKGVSMSFPKLIVNMIKILSGLSLLKSIPAGCSNDKVKSYESPNDPFDLCLMDKEDSCDDLVSRAVERCCSLGSKSSKKSIELSQDTQCRLDVSSRCLSSSSEVATSSGSGGFSSKLRFGSSMNSRGDTSKHLNGICSTSTTKGLHYTGSNGKKQNLSMDPILESDCSEDPFAFDDGEFKPTKWDLQYGKKKPRKSKSSRLAKREANDVSLLKPRRTQDSDNVGYNHQEESGNPNAHLSEEASSSGSIREEDFGLLSDCLLSGVKVLMNLTNDNPLGCKQIAACGGLETIASVIASHFPAFCSSTKLSLESKEKNPCLQLSSQTDKDLSDQELDLLVAILGLLVNLVEKDGNNRARLTKAKVKRHGLEGLDNGSGLDVVPLLCSIFMSNRGSGEAANDEKVPSLDDEDAMLQGEKEAEKMILEAYSALLLAFLSTESKFVRDSIAAYLPQGKIAVLVPVLERFVAFHVSLDMMTPETHKTVREVIESCRVL
ncbi:hypothetical protein MLD38_019352 [Melastoma candidum]|uniref:Uncharacterized protein n=1 Tax=Melastoma candidum TaxID=119954 RepID=A0ACB9QWQ4_9MYRT|nr:hypothetical protein MLD38_019352 [Melastoma candidum]